MRRIINWIGAIIWQLLFWGAITSMVLSCTPERIDPINDKPAIETGKPTAPLAYFKDVFNYGWDSMQVPLNSTKLPATATLQANEMQIVFGMTGEVVSGPVVYQGYYNGTDGIHYTFEWNCVNSKTKGKSTYVVVYARQSTTGGAITIVVRQKNGERVLQLYK